MVKGYQHSVGWDVVLIDMNMYCHRDLVWNVGWGLGWGAGEPALVLLRLGLFSAGVCLVDLSSALG